MDGPARRRAARASSHRCDGAHLGRGRNRTEFTAWKKYPNVESELLNVHGLNNKISLFVDCPVGIVQ